MCHLHPVRTLWKPLARIQFHRTDLMTKWVHLKSCPARRTGLLNINHCVTLNSSYIMMLSQSNGSTLDWLGAWFHDPLDVLLCFWQLHVMFFPLWCLDWWVGQHMPLLRPPVSSHRALASLHGPVEPHVMAQPTPEAWKQRDGAHNLFAVMFVSSHKTEGCGFATITAIEC